MDGLEALYERSRIEAGLARGLRLRRKPFRVSFHAYAGLRSVIFDRRTHYEMRLAEPFRAAPAAVHESLARVLVGKLDRRLRPTPAEGAPFRAWCRSPSMQAVHDALRRARGHKRMREPRGRAHDLGPLFDRLNEEYFGGDLPRARLGWSPTVGRALYGHHDPSHDAIVVNRLLDHPRVPEAVVASILFHEMLHVKHGVQVRPDGRRIVHPRALRLEERRFRQRDEARRFLDDLEARRIRLRHDA